MAVAFGLVADFREDEVRAKEFQRSLEHRLAPVSIGKRQFQLHHPILARYTYDGKLDFQVSIIPVGVGLCVAMDRSHPQVAINSQELSELGHHLYSLLRGAPSFDLALVGWDVDFLLNVHDLNDDHADEIRDGSLHGLVVAFDLIPKLPATTHFVPFDGGHMWLPYTGSIAMADW